MRPALFLILLSFSSLLHAQDEVLTLKVVKKNPIRESSPGNDKPSSMFVFESGVAARINQSFAAQGWGGEMGLLFSCITLPYIPSIEIQYSRIAGHFDLSGYAHSHAVPHEEVERSLLRMEFIKMPLVYTFGHWVGPDFSPYIEAGVIPAYLVKVQDHLTMEDMKRLNCAYTFGGGIHLATNLRLGLRFSGDVLPNLKNNMVYNETGEVIGKQNSRKYLISFSAAYRLDRHYLFVKK